MRGRHRLLPTHVPITGCRADPVYLSAVGFWRVRKVVKYSCYLRIVCVVSGFRRCINEIFALLRRYAALIGSYGCFGTIY